MGFLSFLKGMKIEDNCPIDITFRTSRTCGFLGAIMAGCGLGLAIQIYCQNPLFCYFNLIMAMSVVLSLALVLLGVLIATYRKCVILSKMQSRIDYMESSLFCWRRATYHFREVVNIEVCRIEECFITSKCPVWTVKAYIRRHNELETIRLFEGLNSERAEEAATYLSQVLRFTVLHTTKNLGMPTLSPRVQA